MPYIELINISKIFGKKPRSIVPLLAANTSREEILEKHHHLVAVNNVNLTINEGEITVIIGLSGSGKSTLLRCINKLIEPTSGSIIVKGVDITHFSQKELRHMRQTVFSMVFQNFSLFPHISVLENTAFGLEVMGVPKKERHIKAMESLAQVGLAERSTAMPRELSGGMQQRVGLARALATSPTTLLMDEPFSALDPLTRREMQDELLRLNFELNKTIIFITHDMDEALSLGNKIVMMRDGCIIQEGTAEEILSNPASEYVTEFVKGADRGKVLTAESIMIPPVAVFIMGLDGPHTALRKMQHNNISSLFVVNSLRILKGILFAEDIARMKEQGTKDIAQVMHPIAAVANIEDPLKQLIPAMASLPYPLPIVDTYNRLRGVVVRGLLLGALSNESEAKEEAI